MARNWNFFPVNNFFLHVLLKVRNYVQLFSRAVIIQYLRIQIKLTSPYSVLIKVHDFFVFDFLS